MSAALIILKPSFSDEMVNATPVALTALLPFEHISKSKMREYFGAQPYPEIEILDEGTLVLERAVDPEDSQDLNAQAWAFAAELQLAFSTGTPHVY